MATLAPAPHTRAIRAERVFYSGMAIAILATVIFGFAPSFYLRGEIPAREPMLPLTPLIVVHGLLFSGWVLLFATQVSFVSARRLDLHRRMGAVGLVLVTAMLVVGTSVALGGVARHSGAPGIPPLSWLAVPLLDLPVFASLIALALYKRRTPQTHKRLMLIAMIGLLAPSLGRMPWPPGTILPLVIIGGLVAYLLPLAIWDVATRGRLHPATIGGGAFLIGSWIFRFAIWRSAVWLAFAGWAASFAQ
jgi:hypothetical protein